MNKGGELPLASILGQGKQGWEIITVRMCDKQPIQSSLERDAELSNL